MNKQQTLISLAVICATAYGCTESGTLKKEPVEFRPATASSLIKDTGETSWFFHCAPDFDYKILESYPVEGRVFVRLKINKASLRVGLTIEQTVGENSSEQIKQHEDGHVEICRKLYDESDAEAHIMLRQVQGRDFAATAATEKEAVNQALREAGEFICARYRERTAGRADIISARYDEITSHGGNKVSSKEAVRQAFSAAN